jgi:pimeloyl-ACP methyl ester carboxylesterase
MKTASLPEYTTDSVISADGTKIGLRKLGKGPGVILVHGAMCTSNNLLILGGFLSTDFSVYIPDRRGRGMSGPHGPGHNVAKECEDIRTIMENTGTSYLFGHSAGALIVLEACLTVPGVCKAALYEPPLSIKHSYSLDWVKRYNDEISRGNMAAAFVTVLKGTRSSGALASLPRFLVEPLFRRMLKFADPSRLTPGETHPKELLPTFGFDAGIAIEMADKEEKFKDLQVPVLLMGGSRSPSYLKKALDGLEHILPHAQRVTFRGMDHIAPDNDARPDIVADEVIKFLSKS